MPDGYTHPSNTILYYNGFPVKINHKHSGKGKYSAKLYAGKNSARKTRKQKVTKGYKFNIYEK
jgi:hypothetical protein